MQSRVNKIYPRNNLETPSLLNVKTVKGGNANLWVWVLQFIIAVQELARVGEYDNVK